MPIRVTVKIKTRDKFKNKNGVERTFGTRDKMTVKMPQEKKKNLAVGFPSVKISQKFP